VNSDFNIEGHEATNSEEDIIAEEFIRHFAKETAMMLLKAKGITLYREMETGQKLMIFMQGVMITIAGVLMDNIDPKKGDPETITRIVLQKQIDIGVMNAKRLIEMKERSGVDTDALYDLLKKKFGFT
jgi:hypothetical protein